MTHIKVTRKTIVDGNVTREVFNVFHGIRWILKMKWYRDGGDMSIEEVLDYLKPWIGCTHVKIYVAGVEDKQ